jgi:UDP-glucose 4-epimerase
VNISGRKVVVVGGAGFIGSHIVEALLAEPVAEVVVFDNFTRGTKRNLERALADRRVKVFEGDITHTDLIDAAFAGADCVFHLAALWLLHCHEYPRAAFRVNIEGTFNVIEACVRHEIKRLVYSSSASVYGDALETPMTEDHPYNNRTFYGATKIAGEHMARSFHARYGMEYVGLRYMNVYGPRQDYRGAYTSVIMKILDRLDRGQPPVVYGDGSQTYDFITVEDTARANICALKADTTDRFYNVGSGAGTSIKQLAELILEVTGSTLPIEYEPAGQTFVTQRIGSTRRAQVDLGFSASSDLRAGLRRLIAWRNEQPDTGTYPI